MTTDLRISDIRIDGGTQSRVGLNKDVVLDYTQAMQAGTMFPPVTVYYDGDVYWLADGFHRIAAAKEAGLKEFPADVRQGTRREAVLYSVGANGRHGLRRTNEDKRRAVTILLEDAEWSKWSNNEIAKRCDVSEYFVRTLRPHFDKNEVTSERTYTTRHGTVATMDIANIGHKPAPAARAAELSNSGPWTPGEKQYLNQLQNLADANHERSVEAQEKRFAINGSVNGAVYPPASADDAAARRAADLAAINSSESPEWYTPARYIEAAREVLGEIDLDPASCALANETVKAKAYYDQTVDGLSQAWHGRIWLNPPYGRTETNASSQGVWADYLIDQYQRGSVDSALLLINAKTSEKWFQPLWDYAVCFVSPRINFDAPPGAPANGSNHGSAIVYLGRDYETFARVFGEFGRIIIPAASLGIKLNRVDLDGAKVSITL
jgi:hypothetical protein